MLKRILVSTVQLWLMGVVLFCFACSTTPKPTLQADVLVVGGGTGGTAAAIQSARSGAKTILVCETPWLGGMLTAAGVSCTDGNHLMPSGLWQEFREAMYAHYGTRNLATGWVSNFNFEPHVGARIFAQMAAAEPNLTVLYRHSFSKVYMKDAPGGKKAIDAVAITDSTGTAQVVSAAVYIDATELGDLLAAAGAAYDVGLEPEDLSGEKGFGVTDAFGVIQDLTYAAVLKDYGPGADKTIPRPANYTDVEFACSSNEDCNDSTRLYSKVDAQKMLDYGRLPNGKFMINWPSNGNDYFTDIIHRSPEQRTKALDSAKQKTLRFVYYIQTRLGKKHIGLADDEYDTPDQLPYMPYHREGRRLQGMVRLTSADIIHLGTHSTLYRTGISVGDYPIDHHHRMYPGPQPDLTFVPVPSYSVPAGAMVPRNITNLLVCDKSISVSNIMNGTTRLQPVVLLTGQAAGLLAAQVAQAGQPVQQASVRTLQAGLLQAGACIMPYADVLPTDPAWAAIQRVGATGLMMGTGQAIGWANRTWFYPDSLLTADTLALWAGKAGIAIPGGYAAGPRPVTAADLQVLYAAQLQQPAGATVPAGPLTRRQIALWLDTHLNFFSKPVDWAGAWVVE